MNHQTRKIAALFVAGSVVLFVASLTQIGFYFHSGPNSREPVLGLMALLVGWLGVMAGFENPFSAVFAWLANPALAATWIFMFVPSSRRFALGCGVCSLVLSLSFLLHSEIMADEAGSFHKITGYGAGYWLWIGSIVVTVIGCITVMKLQRSLPNCKIDR